MDNYDSAVHFYQKALYLRQKVGDKKGIAASYHNIAICLKSKENFKAAEENYKMAIEIQESINDADGLALSYINMGKLYFDVGKYKESIVSLNKALRVSQELNYLDNLQDTHEALYEAYVKTGDAKKALFHHVHYTALKDSLINTAQAQEFTRIAMQHSFDKQTAAGRIEQEKKDVLAAQEKRLQRIILLAISGFGLLVLGFAIFAYRSFLQKKKANNEILRQKQEVELQKHLVENKQKEILDSIHYARRIQSSLLASEKYIERSLKRLRGR